MDAYLEGIRLFNAGEFWHAHEQWESCWLAAAKWPARRMEAPLPRPGPELDPEQPVPDDPAELLPDAPEPLPPAPIESTPDDPGGDPGGVPEPA